MDPKQTEGQKVGPASQPQGGFSFQTGTLSTGANIARTMNDLNVNERKSATVNSPFAKHHFNKVVPQTGDIIIEQSNKKSNGLFFKKVKNPAGSSFASSSDTGGAFNRGRLIQFGLIFGGIALVGLVIFTVAMLINQPKTTNNTNNSNSTVVTDNPEKLFDEYLQKLVIGEVGKTEYVGDDEKTYSIPEILQAVISNSSVNDGIFYADRVINFNITDERNDYINELNDIFSSFSSSYSGNNADILNQISYYYYDFAKIQPVFDKTIIDLYQNKGYEQALADIDIMYGFNDDRGINDYNAFSHGYASAILNLINDAKIKIDCNIIDRETAAACPLLSSIESYQAYIDSGKTYYTSAAQIKQEARNNALQVLGQVYLEYHDNLGTNEEER